jgi:hypothetical protein
VQREIEVVVGVERQLREPVSEPSAGRLAELRGVMLGLGAASGE